MTTTVGKKTKRRTGKECGFQHIPHWDDPEVGAKALIKCIKNYISYKYDEFKRLAPVITPDEFLWDTFSNMCRRDGYPQYDKNKNRGNFYSYVQINCARNQADWARKRNTKARQLAALQGVELPEGTEHPEYTPILNLDDTIEGSDDTMIHEKVKGETLDGYTEDLAKEEIMKNISTEKISEKFCLSWKQFAGLLMDGWSVVDISKRLEVNPTTTRKYYAQLKERLLKDTNIQDMLESTGIQITIKSK